jgi:hypothetical protein
MTICRGRARVKSPLRVIIGERGCDCEIHLDCMCVCARACVRLDVRLCRGKGNSGRGVSNMVNRGFSCVSECCCFGGQGPGESQACFDPRPHLFKCVPSGDSANDSTLGLPC